MKKSVRLSKVLCIILAFLLVLPLLLPAFGTGARQHRALTASPTLEHGEMVFQNSGGRQAAHYLHITPGADIRPIVSAGGSVFGASNLNNIIGHASGRGHNVLGGINADFFAFSTGVSEGIYISDGQFMSSHHGRSAIFFNEDGSGFVTRPNLNITLQNTSVAGSVGMTVPFFNKTRHAAWPVLYDHNFSSTTRAQTSAREVIFRIINGSPSVGGAVTLEVVRVQNTSGATALREGYMVLSADTRSPYISQLDNFVAGNRVQLNISASDSRINNAAWGVGAGDILVEGGRITSGWDPNLGGRHPRTALGFGADGSVIFYTVDGRLPDHSAGLTLGELAEELIALGAHYVVNLDGGGSTTFSYRVPGTQAAAVQNRVSGGVLRNVSNAILLTSVHERGGPAVHMQMHPRYMQVLANSLVSPNDISRITTTDRGYFPVATGNLIFESITASNPAIGEQVDQRFQVGARAASGTLHVETSTGLSSSMPLNVATAVNTIDVRRDGANIAALTLAENGRANLSFHALSGGQAVFASSDLWDIRVPQNIGTLDQNGVLRITGDAGARGEIVIRVGGAERRLPVHIAEHFIDIERHWARAYINQMRLQGVVAGVETSDGLAFLPNRNLNRMEFSAMLIRLLDIDTRNYTLAQNHFIDHAQIPNWARPYVAAMVSRGYIAGRPSADGLRFDPSAPITRAEAFTILGRLLDIDAPTSALNQFPDRADIPAWAVQEIARLAAMGMLRGGTDGRLNPGGLLTRAEGAAILARLDVPALRLLEMIADYDADDFVEIENCCPQDDVYPDDVQDALQVEEDGM